MLRAILVGALAVCVSVGSPSAREAGPFDAGQRAFDRVPAVSPTSITFDDPIDLRNSFALAAANTTVLYSATFDAGGVCTSASWTVVDLTAQVAEFWHVDDFAGANVNVGDSYAPLADSKSLWCGARASATALGCEYLTLPGYGNRWNQTWQTKSCIPVNLGLDVSFLMQIDSESGYDAVFLERTTDCNAPFTGWSALDGGIGVWDGVQATFLVNSVYPGSGSQKIRIRFASGDIYSDEDGFYDCHAGPVVIDNLTVEQLPTEDFEGEAVNATATEDWEADVEAGYGVSMALFYGWSLVQQDACAKNMSCMWAAIAGSTTVYSCGDFIPTQPAVPDGNGRGQYLANAIWSPQISLTGSGSVIDLQFTVYRDMPLDALVFYEWSVRSYADPACRGPWRDRGFVYYGGQKDWALVTYPVGDLIAPSATTMQVSLSIVDLCARWCGVIGSGICSTHAPLLDKVRVYRVDIVGPSWIVNDIDMFQDTFPDDGTATGIGRADRARSVNSQPGDAVVLICSDPLTAVAGSNPSGLADDTELGGKQIYLYVHCDDVSKSGAMLTDTPAAYPFKDTVVAGSKTWTRVRCEQTAATSGSEFRVDLNDALFDGGDIVEFFFGATNTNGQTSYCSGSSLNFVQGELAAASQLASEFTILPRSGYPEAILYVDGMDGRGSQPYWDYAYHPAMVLTAGKDRFDVRGPGAFAFNNLGAHVVDVENQLYGHYSVIAWDAGDLESPLRENDYATLNQFLEIVANEPGGYYGGVYICGDDAAASLHASAGTSAVTFRDVHIPFTLTSGNHRPTYGVTPLVKAVPGGPFYHPSGSKDFFVTGACPLLNDFDVMTPTGTTIGAMTYGPPASNNAAVLTNRTGRSGVVLSGFSLVYIRDDHPHFDRGVHYDNILNYLASFTYLPVVGVPRTGANALEQNYPNPFNPVTTIAFAIKERSHVRIDVFDVSGARVRTLVDETRAAGAYSDVHWDGRDAAGQSIASGVYFCKLTAGDFSQTRKMVLLK